MKKKKNKKNKYNARKVMFDGIEFDSKKELNRWLELKDQEECEVISNLRRQVEYVLIPNQYAESTEVYKKGKKKGQPKQGKLLERKLSYIADFVYTDATGKTIVEDVKGYRGGQAYSVFKIKRKLMLFIHGVKIHEY
jgi:hypothetical protein